MLSISQNVPLRIHELFAQISEDLRIIEQAVIERFQNTVKAVEEMDEIAARELIKSYRSDLGKLSDNLVATQHRNTI